MNGLATAHWSASPPQRLRAYHEEFALTGSLDAQHLHNLRVLKGDPLGYSKVPWDELRAQFTLWKNDSFTTPTDYGTWDVNRDPRDGTSPNVEVAAMCMGDATTTNFGTWPYTIAHAWIHAGIIARICALKGFDSNGSFDASVAPQLQNGPIFVVSTHGERAIQTVNWNVSGAGASSEAASKEFGYFLGSGDGQSRWDITFLDPEYIPNGVSVASAKSSAAWVREQAHLIKAAGDFPGGMWSLDGGETP